MTASHLLPVRLARSDRERFRRQLLAAATKDSAIVATYPKWMRDEAKRPLLREFSLPTWVGERDR